MPAKAVTVSVIIGEILPSPVTVSYMEVKTPPTKVTYTEGEALDLMGLELRLTKSDATTEDVGFADFGAKGITVSPANGTVLTTDNTELIITADGKITTQAITVNQDVSQDQSWSDFSISGATSFSQGLADDTAIIAISNVKKNDANTVDAADTVLTGNLVIKINGQIVDADHYTVDDEADTITLWQAYLNTLTEGSHQFTVEYTDTANNVSQQISGYLIVTVLTPTVLPPTITFKLKLPTWANNAVPLFSYNGNDTDVNDSEAMQMTDETKEWNNQWLTLTTEVSDGSEVINFMFKFWQGSDENQVYAAKNGENWFVKATSTGEIWIDASDITWIPDSSPKKFWLDESKVTD